MQAVETELHDRLAKGGYLKEPQIGVSVDQYRSQQIFVIGEVRQPGSLQFTGSMSVIEALAGPARRPSTPVRKRSSSARRVAGGSRRCGERVERAQNASEKDSDRHPRQPAKPAAARCRRTSSCARGTRSSSRAPNRSSSPARCERRVNMSSARA